MVKNNESSENSNKRLAKIGAKEVIQSAINELDKIAERDRTYDEKKTLKALQVLQRIRFDFLPEAQHGNKDIDFISAYACIYSDFILELTRTKKPEYPILEKHFKFYYFFYANLTDPLKIPKNNVAILKLKPENLTKFSIGWLFWSLNSQEKFEAVLSFIHLLPAFFSSADQSNFLNIASILYQADLLTVKNVKYILMFLTNDEFDSIFLGNFNAILINIYHDKSLTQKSLDSALASYNSIAYHVKNYEKNIGFFRLWFYRLKVFLGFTLRDPIIPVMRDARITDNNVIRCIAQHRADPYSIYYDFILATVKRIFQNSNLNPDNILEYLYILDKLNCLSEDNLNNLKSGNSDLCDYISFADPNAPILQLTRRVSTGSIFTINSIEKTESQITESGFDEEQPTPFAYKTI